MLDQFYKKFKKKVTRNDRQILGIRKWQKAKCRGTLEWATGVGKTRAAILAIKAILSKNPNIVIKIVVPTEHLKIQWLQSLSEFGLFRKADVEIINSAVKIKSKVDFLIIDEVHRIPSETFFKIFKQKFPTIVLGLTATFERLDGKHTILEKYCPICDTITIKEAVKNKWLSPYKEYKVLITVDDIDDYKYHNRIFYENFAYFDFDFNEAMKCLTNIRYRRYYAKLLGMDHKAMDAIIYSWNRSLKARKGFVMNHPKKIEIAKKILESREYRKAITFSATIKQAEELCKQIGGYVVHSKKAKKKNRLTIEEFAALPTGIMHTAKSLDEGSDIPGLSLGIILSNTSSGTQKTQRIGRVIRYSEGKEAEIFTTVIKGTNEEAWYNNSTAGKPYIEITEEELEDVLKLKDNNFKEKTGNTEGLLFRM